jgi:hypothetical protein
MRNLGRRGRIFFATGTVSLAAAFVACDVSVLSPRPEDPGESGEPDLPPPAAVRTPEEQNDDGFFLPPAAEAPDETDEGEVVTRPEVSQPPAFNDPGDAAPYAADAGATFVADDGG